MKKTVLEYTTDTYQEDIPKHILQDLSSTYKCNFLGADNKQ